MCRASSSTTARSIRATTRAATLTIVSVFEAIGAYRAGKMTPRGAVRDRERGLPRRRAPAAASSPPTRCPWSWSSSGLSPAGLNGIPAEDPGKDDAARQAGELVMTLVRHDIRPSIDRQPGRHRERDRVGRGHRRLDERRAPPAGDRPRVRHPARRSTSSGRSPSGRRSSPTCARWPVLARGPVRRGRDVARHARAAQAGPPPRRREERRRPDAREDRGGCRGDAGPAGRRPDRDAAQADRRPHDPARLPRARGLRGQARGP